MGDPALPPVRLPRGREIADTALRERATTSGGPGGQHVNKTATRVELRVNLHDLPLSDAERELLRERLGARITRSGDIVVSASSSRSQLDNRKMARRRLQRLLGDALHREAPRVATKASRSAVRRSKAAKSRHSDQKTSRRWRPSADD